MAWPKGNKLRAGKPNLASAKNGLLGGRPDGITDEVVAKIKHLIETYSPTYEALVTKRLPDGSEVEKMEILPNPPLTRLVIADTLGISRCALWDWSEKDDRISNLLKRTKELNQSLLIENGIMGRYDKTMSIFLLKQPKYGGFTDKSEVEHSANDKMLELLKAARGAVNADVISIT